jgi:hypothetical protein
LHGVQVGRYERSDQHWKFHLLQGFGYQGYLKGQAAMITESYSSDNHAGCWPGRKSSASTIPPRNIAASRRWSNQADAAGSGLGIRPWFHTVHGQPPPLGNRFGHQQSPRWPWSWCSLRARCPTAKVGKLGRPGIRSLHFDGRAIAISEKVPFWMNTWASLRCPVGKAWISMRLR